jgi:hypothetical protein
MYILDRLAMVHASDLGNLLEMTRASDRLTENLA